MSWGKLLRIQWVRGRRFFSGFVTGVGDGFEFGWWEVCWGAVIFRRGAACLAVGIARPRALFRSASVGPKLNLGGMTFEWDYRKAAANLKKSCAFADAATVFL